MINFAETAINISPAMDINDDSTNVESSLLLAECVDLFLGLNNLLFTENAMVAIGKPYDGEKKSQVQKSNILVRVWVIIKNLVTKLFNYAMGFFSNKYRHAMYDVNSVKIQMLLKDVIYTANIFTTLEKLIHLDFSHNNKLLDDINRIKSIIDKCDTKILAADLKSILDMVDDEIDTIHAWSIGEIDIDDDELKHLLRLSGNVHHGLTKVLVLDGLSDMSDFLRYLYSFYPSIVGHTNMPKRTGVSTYYKAGVDSGITNDMNLMSSVKNLFESLDKDNIKKDILDNYANDIVAILNKNYRFKTDADINVASREFQYTDLTAICDGAVDNIPIDISLLCANMTPSDMKQQNPQDGIIRRVMQSVTSNRQTNMIKNINVSVENIPDDKINYAKLCVFTMKVITDNQKLIQTSLSIVTILHNLVYEYYMVKVFYHILGGILISNLQQGRI